MPYRNPANPDLSEWGGPKAKKLSPQLKRILKKATHPNPAKRYSSIAAMAVDLKNLHEVYGGGARAPYLSIAAIIIVIAVAAFFTKDRWLPLLGMERETTRTEASMKGTEAPPIDEVIDSVLESTDEGATESGKPSTTDADKREETPIETEEPARESAKKTEESEEPARIVTEKQEEKPAVTETKEKEPEKPPPPPMHTMQITVVPEFNTVLMVDDVEKSLNKTFEVDKGRHEIMVINPDYPIHSEALNVQSDRKLRYNLQDEFSLADSLTFRIGALPPDLEDVILEVSFNRHAKRYGADNLPILDLRKIAGKWEIRFRVLTAQGTEYSGARIDSAVTFPYGGGPREVLKGRQSIVDFGSTDWKGVESVDMLVYWTKK
jgi:hypothetical protein